LDSEEAMDELINLALTADQELQNVDFKESFDVNSKAEWCEILKDIVAMANSGGGVLIIGVKDNGDPSGSDVTDLSQLDPAKLTDKIYSYTGQHFSNFKINKAKREGNDVVLLCIGESSIPMIFTSPGNYQSHDGKQKMAFNVGVIYFRHGAKSEPGTSNDLSLFLTREIEKVKTSWLSGIRKVIEAPEGSQVVVFPLGTSSLDSLQGNSVRVVDDPNAPTINIREEDFFRNYPYDYRALTLVMRDRYTDFVENVNYHTIRRFFDDNPLFCKKRMLNPNSPRSAWTKLYSRAILHEFDKHYTRKSRDDDVDTE
jgi:hypothetical protein